MANCNKINILVGSDFNKNNARNAIQIVPSASNDDTFTLRVGRMVAEGREKRMEIKVARIVHITSTATFPFQITFITGDSQAKDKLAKFIGDIARVEYA